MLNFPAHGRLLLYGYQSISRINQDLAKGKWGKGTTE
jgi:hypothetical protein